ncbi:hypothetical protein AYL99_01694 [Fonsecaea erecta]|uniref:Uncharacterized protein n=1 Tax=Fonsecaea erecta TaxID=1367422 RepID=A0A179A157_9EURO|nr:hypothetical protein AYL99_01694 [Fonsecaea erecta]OAP65722.1 hypothetical protein AYL99_01694 [Fonsecaea erecta]
MVPDDRLTAEQALTREEFAALTVTSSPSQAASSGEGTSIKSSAESSDDGRPFRAQPSRNLEITKDKEVGNMSETVTQHQNRHLWLSAEPEYDVPFTTTTTTASRVPIPSSVSAHHRHYDSEVIIRSPTNITLDVTVRVSGKAPTPALNITLPAGKCSLLSDLRAHIAATGSGDASTLCSNNDKDGWPLGKRLLHLIRDLRKVTFRLEEDGHIAKLNITRTRIDASCVFPETEYEAWYYRNVLRGKQRVYTVEVNIEA